MIWNHEISLYEKTNIEFKHSKNRCSGLDRPIVQQIP